MIDTSSKTILRAAVLTLALVGCGSDDDNAAAPVPCTGNIVDRSTDVSPIHDPALTKSGDTYYLYSTSEFASFYTSPDLEHWTLAGQVFDAYPDWIHQHIPNADHIGAPDIAKYRGRYIMFYQTHIGGTCNAGISYVSNTTLDPDDPEYEWVDHGLILRSTPLLEGFDLLCGVEDGVGGDVSDDVYYNAIDPHLFVDDDGSPWLVFGSTLNGLLVAELDPDTLEIAEHPRDFVSIAARPIPPGPFDVADFIIEAPYVVRRDGYYYLFLSHNSCCLGPDTKYKVLVGRSQNLEGPYVDRDGVPLLDAGGTVLIEREGNLIGTGHSDVFIEGDTHWLVHHAYDADQDYVPVLNIRKLEWDDEGWPHACQTGPAPATS